MNTSYDYCHYTMYFNFISLIISVGLKSQRHQELIIGIYEKYVPLYRKKYYRNYFNFETRRFPKIIQMGSKSNMRDSPQETGIQVNFSSIPPSLLFKVYSVFYKRILVSSLGCNQGERLFSRQPHTNTWKKGFHYPTLDFLLDNVWLLGEDSMWQHSI